MSKIWILRFGFKGNNHTYALLNFKTLRVQRAIEKGSKVNEMFAHSNITDGKLGMYTVELRLPSGEDLHDYVVLFHDRSNTLQGIARTLATVIVIIILLPVFLGILHYFRLYLRLIKKRYCGAYESGKDL